MKPPKPLAAWMDRVTARRSVGDHWPATLDRSKVFILPSRFGLLAAAATLVMLMVALNYQNSPVFLLTFFLGSLLLVAMVACHQHLRGLVVVSVRAKPVFAGEPIRLRITVANRGSRTRNGLAGYANTATSTPASLAAGAERQLQLALPPRRRGRHRIRHCGLATKEPLGVFRAWSRLAPVDCIVYPAPVVGAPPPPGLAELTTQGRAHDQPEDFLGLARYRPGDRPSQIAWPSYARGREVERKTFGGSGGGSLWLDFDDTPGKDVEIRLSVLAAWMLEIERGGGYWGLRLPAYALAPARGEAHLARALTALALFPGPYPQP